MKFSKQRKSSPMEKGQGFMEYGMVIILAAIILMILVAFFGEQLKQLWTDTVGPILEAFGNQS